MEFKYRDKLNGLRPIDYLSANPEIHHTPQE